MNIEPWRPYLDTESGWLSSSSTAMLLKLECAYESPEDLAEMQVLIQQGQTGPQSLHISLAARGCPCCWFPYYPQ